VGIHTYGTNAVDWEQRIHIDRLRGERLERLRAELERSSVGAVLAFDFTNIRYMTSTHIGTWAIDKLIRYALLVRGCEPIIWDFGSAAKHHQLYAPWLDYSAANSSTAQADGDVHGPHHGASPNGATQLTGARAGISTLRGAFHPQAGIAEEVAGKIKRELEAHGLQNEPLGVDVIELPVLAAFQQAGIQVVDGQQIFLEARRVKTGDEIKLLTQAASMVDAAYDRLYEFLRPGVRENECVGLVSKVLYDLGSEYVEGVNAISGERCAPHPHVYSDRLIRPGDPAFFDILHSYMGYRTCYYRTFAVGSASVAQRDAYIRSREYMDQAIALVRPGATTSDIVSVWPTAQEFGFPDEEAAFALQYGHGVGLSIWEKPIFSRLVSLDYPEVLEEGMVFALETYWPGADGWSAARIEEELVVTADGCEVITKFPAEDLLVAGQRYFTVNGPLPSVRDSQSHLNTRAGRGVAAMPDSGVAAMPDSGVAAMPDHQVVSD
jgi:Xaa-Pro aminopeptidase